MARMPRTGSRRIALPSETARSQRAVLHCAASGV
jgi:hypothetical protein